MKLLNKFLGWLGFEYCQKCGRKQEFLYSHGYNDYEVWKCPVCDANEISEYKKFKKSISKLK